MSIYEAVYHELESQDREKNIDTLEDFTGIIRQIHDIVESAANDYIYDYNREDLEEEYLPMI
jgi:hypothetical protein